MKTCNRVSTCTENKTILYCLVYIETNPSSLYRSILVVGGLTYSRILLIEL